MAKYTMELREVLAHNFIFDFEYPIHDEKKRRDFEQAFERHFYFREIAFDTVDMFKHYLRDKFALVFPYYNELMRTATIEYDIENPYNLTETYTRKADSLDKGASFMSGVSRGKDKSSSATDDRRTGETSGRMEQTGSNAQNETVKTDSEVSEKGDGLVNVSDDSHKVNKYMDTPQGLTDLSNSKYLTNMTDDKAEGNSTTDSTSNKDTITDSETVRNASGSEKSVQGSEGSEKSEAHSETVGTVERENVNDSNGRTENIGTQTEEYVLERKGNIGVNPASYEIDMHIKTQQTLKRIYEMFFNECEDLFMQVW